MKLNPSQRNGNRPPTVPPSQSLHGPNVAQPDRGTSHISPDIRQHLKDLTPVIAKHVREVADTD
jgi:hypothetical protein